MIILPLLPDWLQQAQLLPAPVAVILSQWIEA